VPSHAELMSPNFIRKMPPVVRCKGAKAMLSKNFLFDIA
jgi:hypothetical protein